MSSKKDGSKRRGGERRSKSELTSNDDLLPPPPSLPPSLPLFIELTMSLNPFPLVLDKFGSTRLFFFEETKSVSFHLLLTSTRERRERLAHLLLLLLLLLLLPSPSIHPIQLSRSSHSRERPVRANPSLRSAKKEEEARLFSFNEQRKAQLDSSLLLPDPQPPLKPNRPSTASSTTSKYVCIHSFPASLPSSPHSLTLHLPAFPSGAPPPLPPRRRNPQLRSPRWSRYPQRRPRRTELDVEGVESSLEAWGNVW